MDPGDSGVTTGSTLVTLDRSSQLILGSKTISVASGLPQALTTTTADHVITAGSTAVAMMDTTLRPGDPHVRVDGTPVALKTAGLDIVGSKTIPFRTESAKHPVTTVAGQVATTTASAGVITVTTSRPGDAEFLINGIVLSRHRWPFPGRFEKTHV